MSLDEEKRALRRDLWLATIMVAVGLSISGLSLIALRAHPPQQVAQTTPTPQTSPSPPPAESKPGGTRPTTPAPEPARPDPQAQKAGATPALPPAPAEKIAPPIKEK
jgi:hypothetical protein